MSKIGASGKRQGEASGTRSKQPVRATVNRRGRGRQPDALTEAGLLPESAGKPGPVAYGVRQEGAMLHNELTANDMPDGRAGLPCGVASAARTTTAPGDQRTAHRRFAAAPMWLVRMCLVLTRPVLACLAPMRLAPMRLALACLALCAALSVAQPASARAETTQLPGGEYPDAQCTSPMRPFAGDKAWEWDMYRQKMGAYRACVDAYVRRARADIAHIQGKIDKAVREYNREVTMP